MNRHDVKSIVFVAIGSAIAFLVLYIFFNAGKMPDGILADPPGKLWSDTERAPISPEQPPE